MADEDNTLQAKAEKAEAARTAGTVQIWGYRKGKSKLFTLQKGEKLPDGWSDTMPKGEHPHEKEKAALGIDDDDAEDGEVEEPATGKGKGGKKA